jgi:hypothetical protein
MSAPRLLGRAHDSLDLYLAVVDDIDGWPQTVSLPPPRFVGLTVVDTSSRSLEQVRAFAGKLLDQGCVYGCSWGSDADRMHIAFDLEYMERETREITPFGFVTTSSHGDEPLDEALWFSIFAALDAESGATSLLVIAEPQWADQVEERLRDPEQLSRDVLDQEDE